MDEKILKILNQTLQKYDIKGYRIHQNVDWCYGIDIEDEQWIIYTVDKGIRSGKIPYNSLFDACVALIIQVVKEEKTKIRIMREFLNTAYPLDIELTV